MGSSSSESNNLSALELIDPVSYVWKPFIPENPNVGNKMARTKIRERPSDRFAAVYPSAF